MPRISSFRLSRQWLFSWLATILFFGMLEIGSRFWLYFLATNEQRTRIALPSEFPSASKYRPHPYFAYALQPGYRRGGTSHNRMGYRGPEILQPKPVGVFRIVVLGGSTTYGEFIDSDADTFPAQLETILRNDFGHPGVEVINAGVPGYNSWESLVDFQFRGVDLAPDLVIVYFGVNDIHCRLVDPAAYLGDNTGRRKVWEQPAEVTWLSWSCTTRVLGAMTGLWQPPGVENYTVPRSALHRSHQTGWDLAKVLEQNRDHYFARNLKSVIALIRAHGGRPVLATWACSLQISDYVAQAVYQQGVKELNETVLRVGKESGSAVFDFAAGMPSDIQFWRDGRHVNRAGAKIQAQHFAEFLHREYLIDRHADRLAKDANRVLIR